MYIKKLKPFDLPKEAQRISINVSINLMKCIPFMLASIYLLLN